MIYYLEQGIPLFGHAECIKQAALYQLEEWLAHHDVFGVDTETEGFFNHENDIIMLQFGDGDDQFVIDVRGMAQQHLDILRPYFEDKNKLKILHNAKFDLKFFRRMGWNLENVYDTFLAECCLTNGIKDRSLGLDKVVFKYCVNADIDKSERNRFIGLNGRPYTSSQIVYGARDVEYLICVMEAQKEEIQKWKLEPVIDLENKVTLALADIEYNGAYLSATEWAKLADVAATKMVEYEKRLDSLVLQDTRLKVFVKQFTQGSLFGYEDRKVSIKWTSNVQVQGLLKKLGLDIDSAGALEIVKYQNREPLVRAYLDYKKEQKLTTTYGKEFLNYINPVTGRIHTEFWQVLDTHRVSSNHPNLQQIPAKTEKREDGTKYNPYFACFKAPQGTRIVGADFSGQELRLIAEGSQDPIWLDAFRKGEDLHGTIASMIFGIPMKDVKDAPEYVFVGDVKVYLRGKSPRDVTKTINFMLAYGGSKYKLSDTLGIEVDAAGIIIDKYFELVPGVTAFLNKLAAYGRINRYIRSYNPYSIVRQFTGYDFSNQKDVGDVERRSKNTPIQATGAMMCKLALVKIREKIKEMPYKIELFLQVHDAIYTYVDERHAEEWAPIQKEIMEECGRIFIKSIPCISDTKIMDQWEK